MRFLPIVAFLAGFSISAASASSVDAGGIVLEPAPGRLEVSQAITITFPSAIVAPDVIDSENAPPPFLIEPHLPGTYRWKSQTECVFTVGDSVRPGATYRFSLPPNLKDLSGKALDANWGAEFTTDPFKISAPDGGAGSNLNSRPQVHLESNYKVSFAEAAQHIYFQDRDIFTRYAVDVLKPRGDEDPEINGTEFSVTPRQELPPGRAFDLVIDGLLDLATRCPLSHLEAFAVGTTQPLALKWVGAFNNPLETPVIRACFNDSIEASTVLASSFSITPEVPHLKIVASGDQITAEGDFDIAQHYKVTVDTGIKGERGYSFPQPERWGATFPKKKSTVIFPGSEQILQRSKRGLKFAFYQVNTDLLEWSIAPIPVEQLAAVEARIREFDTPEVNPLTGKSVHDPRTGFDKLKQTELLMKAFDLKAAATGRFAGSTNDGQVLRNLEWYPTDLQPLSGPYLIEVYGYGSDGHFVGNHAIVSFSDAMMTQKRSATRMTVRLSKMSDGLPLAGSAVRVFTPENFDLAESVTDKDGIASFALERLFPKKGSQAHLYVAETPDGPAFQFLDATAYASGHPDPAADAPALRSFVLLDRNLYRPGQTVKMHGFVRRQAGARLYVPTTDAIQWWISPEGGDSHAAEGSAPLVDGAWDADWVLPPKAALGEYVIHCKAQDLAAEEPLHFKVEEYRVPLFSVTAEPLKEPGTWSRVKISSAYFHGAPNAGARVHWKASWRILGVQTESGARRDDEFSERSPHSADAESSNEGDAVLDSNGAAILRSAAPFSDAAASGRFDVSWRVDITSEEGQTVTGGTQVTVQSVSELPGVKCSVQYPERAVKVTLDAVDVDDQPPGDIVARKDIYDVLSKEAPSPVNSSPGVEKRPGQGQSGAKDISVKVDLYHVVFKTVREQMAPFVYRYRNTKQFEKVGSRTERTPGEVIFPVKDTGDYVATVTGNETRTPIVSDETFVSGEEYAELPVENQDSFALTPLDKKPFYRPGDIAVFSVRAPFAGVAWVSIEAGEILDTLLVRLDGNSGRVEIPIKRDYAPNAWVSVYLVRPGGDRDLPMERFATVPIKVKPPELELALESRLSAESIEPGGIVQGEVSVTCEEKPVAGADLTVFAVDDAVLKLGDWQLPDIVSLFYPERAFGVRTFNALDHYVDSIKRDDLTEKGFVIGDGGEEQFGNVSLVRKEFQTLAFWKSGLKSDASGKARFEFKAPDNLTSYRVVAVAETADSQFGGTAAREVKVSKRLIVEPALPRFARQGDDFELRAVVRQSYNDSDEIVVRCVTDAGFEILPENGPPEATQSAGRGVPVVFRFPVKAGVPGSGKVRFEAVSRIDSGMVDSVEITLPIQPATAPQRENMAGRFDGPSFDSRTTVLDALKQPLSFLMLGGWLGARGHYDVTLSTAQWLPKILGLPLILDYPHGCFDQISSRLLSYSLLTRQLAYFPLPNGRDARYRQVIAEGLKQCDDSLLPSGMLPYWPGEQNVSVFCTIEACWALDAAAKAGIEVPARLEEALPAALRKVALAQYKSSPFLRAFALMVLSERGASRDLVEAARAVYLDRARMNDEGRALLALALHGMQALQDEKLQLLREIRWPVPEAAFDPDILGSTQRAEAIETLAFNRIAPPEWEGARQAAAKQGILALMDSSSSLSTQENLWLLLAFASFQDVAPCPRLRADENDLRRAAVSSNGASAAWTNIPLPSASEFTVAGLNGDKPMSYLISAEYWNDNVDTARFDRGFAIERVIHNLTAPGRTGSNESPLRLGDQILVTYRLHSRKAQDFVALEDLTPACLETINPDLPAVGKFFELPTDEQALNLSHSDLRDQSTCLYFDHLSGGAGSYSVLARATAAGSFQWPATQIAPMYDARFSGASPSSRLIVTGD